jgi:hypothetical protein
MTSCPVAALTLQVMLTPCAAAAGGAGSSRGDGMEREVRATAEEEGEGVLSWPLGSRMRAASAASSM